VPAIGLALALALLSLFAASLGSASIVILLVATVLLQVAIQSVTVLSQIRMFAVDVNARSRLNTAFVTSTFIGGAIGSALAGVLWQSGGWLALTVGAAVLIGLALVLWLTQRKGALASIPASSSNDVPVAQQHNVRRGLGECPDDRTSAPLPG
jgi:predicted MFS family arabinose efflux permease